MFDIPNYNILVTSRTALLGFSFTYYLNPLNDDHATMLLHHSASLQRESSNIPVEAINKVLCQSCINIQMKSASFYLYLSPLVKVCICIWMKKYYLVLVFDEYMIPYVPYSQPKKKKKRKEKNIWICQNHAFILIHTFELDCFVLNQLFPKLEWKRRKIRRSLLASFHISKQFMWFEFL